MTRHPTRPRSTITTSRTLVALLVLGILAVVTVAPGAVADAPMATVDDAAGATAVATRVAPAASPDFVSISQLNLLGTTAIGAAQAAARAGGAAAWGGIGFGAGLADVRRGGTVVAAAGSSSRWRWQMGATALPADLVARIMSPAIAASLAAGTVVLSQTSASLYGVVPGDVLDLVTLGDTVVPLTVGQVVADADIHGSELLMTLEQAASLGATQLTRVVIAGFADRSAIDEALAAQGLVDWQQMDGSLTRVLRSWSAPNPDSTLSLAETKRLMGDFAYALTSAGVVVQDPQFAAAHIVAARFSGVPIVSQCNTRVVADLQAALTEIDQAGLGGLIDVHNTNTDGGCYNPRFNRVGANLGVLSRHSWGQPIDMNTTTNPLGGVPHMDCRIVRIFRRHDFAWGGNFTSSDGMHFEWVGTPRNTLQYPSRYCPNLPDGAVGPGLRPSAGAPSQAATMFADDGAPGGDT